MEVLGRAAALAASATGAKLITLTRPSMWDGRRRADARSVTSNGRPAQPNRRSTRTSSFSTSPAYLVGCFVSTSRRTSRLTSLTSPSNVSNLSTPPAVCRSGATPARYGSSRSVRSAASGHSADNDSASYHEEKSSASSRARSISLTGPAPSEVRLTVRSCTQTRCPSCVSRTSHSSASAPASMAAW